jgi:cytochrome c peroxidase
VGTHREAAPEDEVMFDQAVAAAASFEETEALRVEYDALLKERDATMNASERRRLTVEVDALAKRLAALEQ